MKLLLVGCLVFASQLALANTECRIKSNMNRELEQGINRTVLCGTVIEKLVEENIYSGESGHILITVTGQQMYAVNLKFKLTTNSQKVSGRGTVYWNPDGSEFVLESNRSLSAP